MHISTTQAPFWSAMRLLDALLVIWAELPRPPVGDSKRMVCRHLFTFCSAMRLRNIAPGNPRGLPRGPAGHSNGGVVRYSATVGNARPYSCWVLLLDVVVGAMRPGNITPPRRGKGIRWTDNGRVPNGEA